MFTSILKGIGFYIIGCVLLLLGFFLVGSSAGNDFFAIVGTIIMIIGIAIFIMGKKIVHRA